MDETRSFYGIWHDFTEFFQDFEGLLQGMIGWVGLKQMSWVQNHNYHAETEWWKDVADMF